LIAPYAVLLRILMKLLWIKRRGSIEFNKLVSGRHTRYFYISQKKPASFRYPVPIMVIGLIVLLVKKVRKVGKYRKSERRRK